MAQCCSQLLVVVRKVLVVSSFCFANIALSDTSPLSTVETSSDTSSENRSESTDSSLLSPHELLDMSSDGSLLLWKSTSEQNIDSLKVQVIGGELVNTLQFSKDESILWAYFYNKDNEQILIGKRLDDRFELESVSLVDQKRQRLITYPFPLFSSKRGLTNKGVWFWHNNAVEWFGFHSRQIENTLPLQSPIKNITFSNDGEPCLVRDHTMDVYRFHSRSSLIRQNMANFSDQSIRQFESNNNCRKAWFIASNKNSNAALYEWSFGEEAIEKALIPIFNDRLFDIEAFTLNNAHKSVTSVSYTKHMFSFNAFDQSHASLKGMVEQRYTNAIYRIMHSDKEGHRFVVELESPNLPKTILWIDVSNKKIVRLNQLEPIQTSRKTNETIFQSFHQQVNGITTTAYLTYPQVADRVSKKSSVEATAKKQTLHRFPLVIRLHPISAKRFTHHYDEFDQYLAAKGIAIVKVNQLGTPGFSKSKRNIGLSQERYVEQIEDQLSVILRQVKNKVDFDHENVCVIGFDESAHTAMVLAKEEFEDIRCVFIAGYKDSLFINSLGDLPISAMVTQAPQAKDKQKISLAATLKKLDATTILFQSKDDLSHRIDESLLIDRLNSGLSEYKVVSIEGGTVELSNSIVLHSMAQEMIQWYKKDGKK